MRVSVSRGTHKGGEERSAGGGVHIERLIEAPALHRCVLVGVCAPSVDVENCILMNVSSNAPIYGRNGLLYNVVHEAESSAGATFCCLPKKSEQVRTALSASTPPPLS